jgi:hypothetical protein
MSKNTFPIVHPKDDGIRSAGLPDHCFYCNKKVGTQHRRNCIAVRKRVRLRLTIDVVVAAPHSLSNQQIEDRFDHRCHLEALHFGRLVHTDLLEVVNPEPNIQIKTEEELQHFGRFN